MAAILKRKPQRGVDVTTISCGGQFGDGVRMDAGAVDEWKFCVSFVEGQCEISASKHDCLDARFLKQPFADRGENRALSFCNDAGRCHRNIGLVHIFQILAAGRDDLHTGNASIKVRLHHRAGSEDADPFEGSLFKGSVNFGNHVNDG